MEALQSKEYATNVQAELLRGLRALAAGRMRPTLNPMVRRFLAEK
jgi:hypothetical protein